MAKPTPVKCQFISNTADETLLLGANIGSRINAPTILSLSGDLGSGKTTFVQGLAKGLDVPDDYYITSPTYTLCNEYPGRLSLFHFDFYRLGDAVDIYSTGFFEKLDSNGIIAVEWADRLAEDLKMDHLDMTFIMCDNTSRIINITAIGPEPALLVNNL